MATKKAPTTKAPEAVAPEQPEITVESLLSQFDANTEQAKAAFLKQQGVKEFLQSLKDGGYEVRKVD